MCQRNENETESTRNWEQWLWMYKHINLPMLQLSYTKIKLDPTYMSKKWKWEKKLKSSSAITSALTWKCFDYHALLKLSSIVICFLVLHFGEAWLVFWDLSGCIQDWECTWHPGTCGAPTYLQGVTQGEWVPAECLSRSVIMYKSKYIHRGTLPE